MQAVAANPRNAAVADMPPLLVETKLAMPSMRQVITVPAKQSTSCAFAGPGLNRLYVTTATEDWSEEQRRREPAAGLVYWCRTDSTGLPAAPFRPNLEWWQEATT
jgi:hypothetical protein